MINERSLTPAELEKREKIIMNMKGNKRDLVKKYGKDAEAVMYGRATNMAKDKSSSKLTELIKDALRTPKNKVKGEPAGASQTKEDINQLGVDDDTGFTPSLYTPNEMGDEAVDKESASGAFEENKKNMKESNANSNYGSNENSNDNSNTGPGSYSGLKKYIVKIVRELKEDEDWIQKAIKRPGALHRALDVPQDKDIPKSLINKDIKKMDKLEDKEGKLDKKDLRFLRQLDLAKTLEKFNEEEIREALKKGFWKKAIAKVDEDEDQDVKEDRATRADKMMSGEYKDEDYKDSKMYDDIRDEVDESYNTLVNKIEKSGKSEKAAKAIAGAVASYKAKGGGKGPTAKQK